MKLLLVLFLATGLGQAAETLRISTVVESESPDADRMTYKTAQGEQVVWVNKKAIVTEKDVKNAYPEPKLEHTIDIHLTEKGGAALTAATSPLQPGRDRMAIIIEGKLHSAPVINRVPLGACFLIEGLTEFDERQLADFARGMMGQPPLGPQDAVPTPPVPIPPMPKQVPYTEEEMKALKVQREQFGIYELDRIPDEAELNKTLHSGMTADEVITFFGKPRHHNRKPDSKDFYLEYKIASYRRLGMSDGKLHPDGFKVEFRDDKVVSWSISSWSDSPCE